MIPAGEMGGGVTKKKKRLQDVVGKSQESLFLSATYHSGFLGYKYEIQAKRGSHIAQFLL